MAALLGPLKALQIPSLTHIWLWDVALAAIRPECPHLSSSTKVYKSGSSEAQFPLWGDRSLQTAVLV